MLVAFSAVLLPRPAATPPAPHPSREGNASTTPAIESQTGPAAGSPTECTDCLDEPIRLYREFSGRTRQSPAAENLALVGEKISDPRYDRRFTIFRKRAPSTGPQALRTDEELSSIKGDLQLTGYRLEFLVALVPDPLDSSLAELFDGGIRGIEDALARSGYLLDRLWFPWDKTEDKNNGAESKQHRLSPGVLLFRRNEPPAHPGDLASRHLLTVLIVGETPKQGVHKTAFHQALRLVRALSDEGNAPLRVLGPSFSGSAESLRIALQGDWLARGGRFTFVSGTATAAGIAHLSPFSLPGITFCRTVPSDSKLTTAAVGFLSEGLGWECGKLALLTERDTAFGTKSSISCGPGARGLRKPLVEIPFLSGLAELRTAREENGTGATPKPDRTGIQVPPSSLALSLAEKRYPVDVVREQSPLTPAADDLALANLFSTMAREDIRYAGIVATDVRDELFLATRIRRVAPDVILFTVDSDLLQAHPQYSAELDGLMVVTSAPLFAESPRWRRLIGGPPHPFFRQFGSKFEKGIYLAAQRLAPPVDLEPAEIAGERGAWISVVGNGALWPIFQRSVYDSDSEALADGACYAVEPFRQVRSPATNPRHDGSRFNPGKAAHEASFYGPNNWLQPDPVLIVPLLALFLAARWMGRMVARLETVPEPMHPSRNDWTSKSPGLGHLWTGGFAVLWVLGAAVMTIGELPIEQQRSFWLAVWGALFSVALWAVAQPEWPTLRRWPSAYGGAALAGALLILIAAEVFLRLWVPTASADAATQNYLFHFRARFLASGLSPLVSLACLGAGFFVWIIAEVKRRTLVRRQRIDWPIPPAGDPALEPCCRLAEPIANILRCPPGAGGNGVRRGFWTVWFALLVASAWLLCRRIQPIAESSAYGLVFAGLLLILASLAAASFVQFFTLWRALDALLDRLQHSRLLSVFRRISDEVKWNPLRSFGRRVPKARLLLLSVSKLQPRAQTELAPLLAKILGSEDLGPLTGEIMARREVNEVLAMASVISAEEIDDPRIEEFFAIRVIAYLRCVVVHLRSSLVGAFAPSLLLLAAVRTYVFAPQRAVSLVLWGSLLMLAALTLWVFVQMDRDDVLSAIAGTEGGQITFDRHFFWNVFVYGAVPILTVVVGQFPQIAHFVVSWLNPLLRVTSAT